MAATGDVTCASSRVRPCLTKRTTSFGSAGAALAFDVSSPAQRFEVSTLSAEMERLSAAYPNWEGASWMSRRAGSWVGVTSGATAIIASGRLRHIRQVLTASSCSRSCSSASASASVVAAAPLAFSNAAWAIA